MALTTDSGNLKLWAESREISTEVRQWYKTLGNVEFSAKGQIAAMQRLDGIVPTWMSIAVANNRNIIVSPSPKPVAGRKVDLVWSGENQ